MENGTLAIIKPLSKIQLSGIVGEDHKARLASHRAVLLLSDADCFGQYLVEETRTGLVYPAHKKHIMRMASATKPQLEELV